MLRHHVIQSYTGLLKYYDAELSRADYMTEKGNSPGLCFAAGIDAEKELGLFGSVTREDMRVFGNKNPATGEQLTPYDRKDRRAGEEITFSAAKSATVYVEWLYGKGYTEEADAIDNAMKRASRTTMARIAERIQTRLNANEAHTTKNMVWFEFPHAFARPEEFPDYFPEVLEKGWKKGQRVADPHRHIHNLIPNATKDTDGRFKSIHFDEIAHHMSYYEAVFEDHFATYIQELGIAVDRQGLSFEIKGISRETIDKFSRRTATVEAEAEKRGVKSDKVKDKLGARTRVNKDEGLSPEETRAFFMARLTPEEDAAFEAIRAHSFKPRVLTPEEALDYAAGVTYVNKSVAHELDFYREAVLHSVGSGFSLAARGSTRIAEAAKTHAPLILGQVDGVPVVTTHDVRNEEVFILDYVRESLNAAPSIAELGARRGVQPWEFRPQVDDKGRTFEFSDEQKIAAGHILESRDLVTGIRGVAGGGKTTLMRETADATKAMLGKDVVAVAPTGRAARAEGLRKEGFADANTLAMLFIDKKMQEKARDGLIWVDEAGMVGAEDMAKLFRLAKELNSRIALMGDTRQHGSVARGEPMRLLESPEGGLRCAEITEIRRQQSAPYLDAAYKIAAGDISGAFDKLEAMGAIIEMKDTKQLWDSAAAAYLGRIEDAAPGERRCDVSLMITPGHGEGQEVTKRVRAAMKADGKLEGERTITTLRNANRNETARTAWYNYKPGEVVEFRLNAKGFTKGDRAVVDKVDNGTVTVLKADGAKLALPLNETDRFDVYDLGATPLAKDDLVRITKGGKDMNGDRLETGDIYEVRGFSRDGKKLLLGTRAGVVSRELDATAALHLRHGYYRTSVEIQGATVRHEIVVQSSDWFGAANRKTAQVAYTRGKHSIVIFTDDIPGLRRAALKKGERTHATQVKPRAVASPAPAPAAQPAAVVAAEALRGEERTKAEDARRSALARIAEAAVEAVARVQAAARKAIQNVALAMGARNRAAALAVGKQKETRSWTERVTQKPEPELER